MRPKGMTKAEFVGKLAMIGERYVIFVPKRYVTEDIKKLKKAPSVKVLLHDEL